ncbi:hypothetical protein B4096_0732 [Heyndrickxia coagulans]|uniref:Uncharacterized protein n=1 Tax=Heyndrickxia coagulans TaxID=1398 RepID=A0A150KDJ9_HEYCO|nr:hypothetical protein B4100_0757 [Heyndrickxia coagulans]KYC67825.1 hypothetical protein B4099_0840 [Heyndrickxia coagulans]KYC89403.1 hypothetical protein B4096_0732 [Heyndrickxia coagulans]
MPVKARFVQKFRKKQRETTVKRVPPLFSIFCAMKTPVFTIRESAG